jgi:hypothetical protein
MVVVIFLFQQRNLYWIGQVQCVFQSRDPCLTTVGNDSRAGALVGLKIRKNSSNLLQFFGTFILKLYIELFSATVMFIKLNTNGQVRPRLDTIQIVSS